MIYTVWRNKWMGGKPSNSGIDEKCLIRDDGNYIGLKTGNLYDKEDYYHSEQFKAKIVGVDENNCTGMYHLYKELANNGEENNRSWKEKYVGCYVTVERAHLWGNLQIYRCNELGDYWSENEIELV